MTRRHRYFQNALILVATALVMRGVSLAFNAYVTREIGAEGMGLFALSMSVYGFAVTFATSGINLAVTRLVAEAIGECDTSRVRPILLRAVGYALFFGGIASAALFFFARPLGVNILRDARTVPSLRLLSVSLVPIALSSVFSGYFTAVRRVSRGAAAQFFEQGVKIAFVISTLSFFVPSGIEYACLSVALGGVVAEFGSLSLNLILFLTDKRRNFRKCSEDEENTDYDDYDDYDDEDFDEDFEDEWDEDEDCDEGFDFGDEDSTIYEVECPVCGEIINFDEETLEEGSIPCPNCGENLEFSLDDDEDEE